MSVKYCLPVPVLAKTITHPAARSLCDSWASCFIFHTARCAAQLHMLDM